MPQIRSVLIIFVPTSWFVPALIGPNPRNTKQLLIISGIISGSSKSPVFVGYIKVISIKSTFFAGFILVISPLFAG